MAWFILFLAGILEIAWAIGMKFSQGFTNLWWSVFTIITMTGSAALLGLALQWLPIGTAYAIWTGIGTIGVAVLGMYLFGDPATAMRLTFIAMIVGGIVGLKVVT